MVRAPSVGIQRRGSLLNGRRADLTQPVRVAHNSVDTKFTVCIIRSYRTMFQDVRCKAIERARERDVSRPRLAGDP